MKRSVRRLAAAVAIGLTLPDPALAQSGPDLEELAKRDQNPLARFVRVQIEDNGVGITPENLTRIFNHGFTTKADGHGFGLHAAANAAHQMGGSLTAASAGAGCGATFTLDLPFEPTTIGAAR